MDIYELKKELERLQREQRDTYSQLVQTAKLRFKWARLACNLTQVKLAAILKLHRSTIGKSENIRRGDLESGGVKTFVNNFLLKFSRYYKTNWCEFLPISQSEEWNKTKFQAMVFSNKPSKLAEQLLSKKSKNQLSLRDPKTVIENIDDSRFRPSFPPLFMQLDRLFSKKREFFPSKKLFDNDLLYFTRHEQINIDNIVKLFLNQKDENIFLLIGSIASGKTVMAIQIARCLEIKKFRIFYHKLNTKSDFDKLYLSFLDLANRKTLFIIDDCHLNLDVSSEILNCIDQLKDLNCLICSRPVPAYARRRSNFDYQDIFSYLAEKDNVFSLNTVDAAKKMNGIIEKYKKYLEKENGYTPILGDLNQIIEKAKGNYLMLYFYLSFWKSNKSLDELDETRILKKMYERYLGNETNEPYQDLILKYAALYQYEIEFEPAKKDEDKTKELVNPIAILERNEDSDYYSFYHPDFARLLLESFVTRDKFKRQYKKGINEFTLEQLKTYFSDFEKYPFNLQEVFFNLFQNNGIELFRQLLRDPVIKKQSIDFFLSESKDALSLIKFISLINNVMPDHARMFCRSLIFENIEIKNLFINTFNPIHTFASALILLLSLDDTYPTLCLNLFETVELRQIILTSSFEKIGGSLYQLSSNAVTEQAANTFLSYISVEVLSDKAIEANLAQTAHTLSALRKLNKNKAKKIFKNISNTDLVEKVKHADLNQTGSSLGYFRRLYKSKTKVVFKQLSISDLVQKAKKADFSHTGTALSTFRKLNETKAQEIFEKISITDLNKKAKEATFTQIGQALGDFRKLNETKAKDIFKEISTVDLVQKAKKAGLTQTGQALGDFRKLDDTKAKDIFKEISSSDLVQKAKKASLDEINQALSHFKNLDEVKTQKIFKKIPTIDLKKKAKTANFAQTIQALSNFRNLDEAKAQKIFKNIELDDLET